MFDLSFFNRADFEASASQAAALLRLLGNEKRLMVLCQLADGELSVDRKSTRLNSSHSSPSRMPSSA